MSAQANTCPHYNHWRLCAPVRFCNLCGEVVNKHIPAGKCHQEHALPQRPEEKYCGNCGERVTQPVLVAMVPGESEREADPAKHAR